jgi:hypothetical protein
MWTRSNLPVNALLRSFSAMVMSATKREATAPSRTLTSFFQPQKIIKTGQSTFSSQTVKTNFDKKLWTDKLTPNQRELLE